MSIIGKNMEFDGKEWWYRSPRGARRRLWSNIKKNKERMFVNGKYIKKTHPLWKEGNYRTFEDAAFDSLHNYTKTKIGEVYIISNPAWEGWYKIGMAIEADDRVTSYQTSSPYRDYKVMYKVKVNNRREAEQKAHRKAEKVAEKYNSEWFFIDIDEAVTILQNIEEEYKDETNT
tara:strand:- start:47 stop:568 length:522 start_codon:yes stop_codon:yes gene_type:complete